MAKYATEAIRAVALVGHADAGKTTLAEALLFQAGVIPAKGSVEKGNTVCDFDPLEKASGHSVNATPGELRPSRACMSISSIPRATPISSASRSARWRRWRRRWWWSMPRPASNSPPTRMMRLAAARGLCRMIIVNKIDADNVDLPAAGGATSASFSASECLLLDLPAHGGQDVVEVLRARRRRRRFRLGRGRPTAR